MERGDMTTAVAAGLRTEPRTLRQGRLAYECAGAVVARSTPGASEREAARMRREWPRERGGRPWFRLSFAWIGDRTAVTGFRVPPRFFPTGRRLEPGLPFVPGIARDLGFRGTRAKSEEVLVVTDSADPEENASWPDDDPPWGPPRGRFVERGGVRRRAEEE
jgi:hypothetical protein